MLLAVGRLRAPGHQLFLVHHITIEEYCTNNGSGCCLKKCSRRKQYICFTKYSTRQQDMCLTKYSMRKHDFASDWSEIICIIMLRDFLWYVILRRIVPGPKTPSATQLLRKTGVTMVKSGFCPYRGLWLDYAPTKRIGIMPTPWMMMDALGLV